MSMQLNKVPWGAYIISFILIQTSILGLGVISIALSLIGYLLLRKKPAQRTGDTASHTRWGLRTLLYAGVLHISAYAIFLVKVLLAEAGSEIAFALFSHAMMHHLLTAGIALFLIYRLARGLLAIHNASRVHTGSIAEMLEDSAPQRVQEHTVNARN